MEVAPETRRHASRGADLPAIASILAGVAAGVALSAFVYAGGSAYLSDDPAACAACHEMQPQLDGWSRSVHRSAAGCNDCHVPPGTGAARWLAQAEHGVLRSLAVATGRFHEPIAASARGGAVTERACRSCHADVVDAIDPAPGPGRALACTRCHADVGHLH